MGICRMTQPRAPVLNRQPKTGRHEVLQRSRRWLLHRRTWASFRLAVRPGSQRTGRTDQKGRGHRPQPALRADPVQSAIGRQYLYSSGIDLRRKDRFVSRCGTTPMLPQCLMIAEQRWTVRLHSAPCPSNPKVVPSIISVASESNLSAFISAATFCVCHDLCLSFVFPAFDNFPSDSRSEGAKTGWPQSMTVNRSALSQPHSPVRLPTYDSRRMMLR